ncbi:MAG TPA: nucleoside hydrolase [Candidatus Limnocylindrales bacterium]|nr:nucleoside hydrolase [Candidatus Limnocylindrales bacterium]
MTDRVPLLLDVDTGIDDALALLYACASPEAELVAVTCIGGNVDARQVAANTLAVLELAGRPDVPVYLGSEQPLRKPLATSTETHGPHGLGYAELPAPGASLADGEAAQRIVELARSRPGELLLVTLGPLTNLALALEREPSLPSLLRGWVLMGGVFLGAGNTTPTSEWNIHVDPDAAKHAFAAWGAAVAAGPAGGTPLPLAMGLEVSERVRIRPEDLRHLAVRAGAMPLDADPLGREPIAATGTVAANPVLRFVADALRFYFEFHARYDGFYGAFIHDPFALAAALDPALVRAEPVFVDVETGENLAHGMTVADWRHLTGRPANVDVAVEGDAQAFLERFIDRVGGLAARRAGVAR